MINQAYDPKMLSKIQQAMRLSLVEFDRICTELQLRYVVYGGSAIGAVRHQGFIPWDDDIDICMPRADYDRFFTEAPALLNEAFVVMDSRTNPDYPKTFGVLGLKGSRFIPGIAANRSFPVPLGIDLFPLDPIPSHPKQFAKQSRATWFWGRLLYLQGTPHAELSLPRPVKAMVSVATHVIHWGIKSTRITPKALVRKWERAARQYENSGSTLFGDFSTRDPKRWSASLEEMFPAQRVPFDDITVMLPRDVDAILTRGYGDYMTIPPENERVNHAAALIDFGPYMTI